MKLLKSGLVIAFVLAISVIIYINNFIVIGIYSPRNSVNENGVIESTYSIKTPLGTDIKGISYAKVFLKKQGFLYTVINIPKDEVGKFVSSIHFQYFAKYPYNKDNLRSFAEIDQEEDPFLMGELYDEYAGFQLKDFPKKYKQNDSVDFVIESQQKNISLIVSKEKNGKVDVFLLKSVDGSETSSLKKELSLRKWF